MPEMKPDRKVNSRGEGIVPEEAKEIESCAFYLCEELKKIIIPDGVTEIGKESFRECKSLESITISGKIAKIDERAFFCCEKQMKSSFPTV